MYTEESDNPTQCFRKGPYCDGDVETCHHMADHWEKVLEENDSYWLALAEEKNEMRHL